MQRDASRAALVQRSRAGAVSPGRGQQGARDELEEAKAKPVREWTNRDVLSWLIDIGQFRFLGAFHERNVTGAMLVEVGKGELDLQKCTTGKIAGASGEDEGFVLHGLLTHIRHLTADLVGKDSVEHGWTYQDDINVWKDIWELTVELDVFEALRLDLSRTQNRLAVLSLVISTVLSTVSVANVSGLGNTGAESAVNFVFMGMSILLTLMTGYSRLFEFGGRVDALAKMTTHLDNVLSDLYFEMSKAPSARRPHLQILKQVKDTESLLSDLKRQVDIPKLEMKGLKRIWNTDESTWVENAGLFWKGEDYTAAKYIPFVQSCFIQNIVDDIPECTRNVRLREWSDRLCGQHFPDECARDLQAHNDLQVRNKGSEVPL